MVTRLPIFRIFPVLACVALLAPAGPSAFAQTDPMPQALPVSQNFGSGTFNSLPAGFAAWNGLSGSSTDTQTEAEDSSPSGNALITAGAPSSVGAGGCYGYALGGNARFAISTSGNSTNGVNQLAMAIITVEQSDLSLTYDVINNDRTVGVVCQYRVGTTGSWTTLVDTGNPYPKLRT